MSYHKNFRKLVLLALLIMVGLVNTTAQEPNIVFILADDWGWTDWERNGMQHGSTFYETPHLNQLAQEGMVFEQAYAHPLCSPSRVALMSGKYPGARIKMHQAITGGSVANPTMPESCGATKKTCFPENRNHMPLDEITIAEELKAAGYTTYQFGKWHLGNSNYYPKKQGFNTQFGVGGAGPGSGGYFAPYAGLSDIPQGPDGEYLCERLTDEVCNKLEQVKDEKFFIYFAHFNVHAPYQSKDELEAKYLAKATADPSNQHRHPHMGAMIESLDSSIGQINAKLNELGLAENTILIVMGDNGGIHWNNDKDKNYLKVPITSNAPLRAGKACFYEGGVRVPLLIKYPPMVDSNLVENTPVHLIDFYPTLLEMTGTSVSPSKDVYDGVSIVPLLEQSAQLDERPIFCHFPRKKQLGAEVGGSYVRMGDYKLCRLYGLNNDASDAFELYNIPLDPGEKKDSSAVLTEITDSLKTLLQNWLDETGAYVPIPNPDWSGYTGEMDDKPTDVKVKVTEHKNLDISWTDNSEGEFFFILERSEDGGTTWSKHDSLPSNTIEYTDSDIEHMQYYQYRLYADYIDSISNISEDQAAGRVNKTGDVLPYPWMSKHFGEVGTQSRATFKNDTFTIDAAEIDYWGEDDKGHYVFKQVTGSDITMTTFVPKFEYIHGFAQAGIMFRESLNDDSKFVSSMLLGDKGCEMRDRISTAGATNQKPFKDGEEKAPYWLRLVKSGNVYTAFCSANGTTWTEIRSVTADMGDTIFIGFASASHEWNNNAIVQFTNIEHNGIVTIDNTYVSKPDFSIYPNPNDGNFIIQLALVENKNLSIEVLDISGKTVYRLENQNYVAGEKNITVNQDFKPGLYLIKLSDTENGFVSIRKVIIK